MREQGPRGGGLPAHLPSLDVLAPVMPNQATWQPSCLRTCPDCTPTGWSRRASQNEKDFPYLCRLAVAPATNPLSQRTAVGLNTASHYRAQWPASMQKGVSCAESGLEREGLPTAQSRSAQRSMHSIPKGKLLRRGKVAGRRIASRKKAWAEGYRGPGSKARGSMLAATAALVRCQQ